MDILKPIIKIIRGDLTPESPENMEFHGQFTIEDDSLNGAILSNILLPEEIILNIFSYLEPREILNCSLVCKYWCNLTKSNTLWQHIYNEREFPKKAKNLPWYVFYCYFTTDNFKNLIKNGNGQEKFKHWSITANGGDRIIIEDIPSGCDPLNLDIPEFNNCASCFTTSYHWCTKYQIIDIAKKHLLSYIIKKYTPKIYASEWYCGRFDCGSVYRLYVICETPVESARDLLQKSDHHFSYNQQFPGGSLDREEPSVNYKMEVGIIQQFSNPQWTKVEIEWKDYPKDINALYFRHQGKDTQFWAGHYGSKFAGGVLKFVFESIEPIPEDSMDSEDV